MKTKLFKTVEELTEFIKEFEERQGKTLDIYYFKLTVALRTRHENRTVDQETDKYIDRELGTIDSVTDMKRAENMQRPVGTRWMLYMPRTMINEQKGETNEVSN